MSKKITVGLVFIMLLVHGVLGMTSMGRKSPTFDEPLHMTAGYSYWAYNDYRIQPENGNLPQRWVALPFLISPPHFPLKQGNGWETANDFFFKIGNDADAMLFKGRFMVLCLSLFLALAVYCWSAQLFGRIGGLISLALFCFSPTILAHARLTTSDLMATLFFTLSLKALWLLLHRISIKSLAAAGLAMAGLLLSKMSAALILPALVMMFAAKLSWGQNHGVAIGNRWIVKQRWRQGAALTTAMVVVLLFCVVIIWGAYGFRFSAAPDAQMQQSLTFPRWPDELHRTGRMAPIIETLRDAKLLPEAFLYGFTFTLSHAKLRSAFLWGDYSLTGWWYFFPFCMAVKTPLVTIFVLIIGCLAICRGRRPGLWYSLTPLVCFSVVYMFAAMNANINIGHRHVLPLYPIMFVLAGATSIWFTSHKQVAMLVCPMVMLVFLIETLTIWPDYLAFFNAAAGGPRNGYRLLVDSSLDWGQDLAGLSRWVKKQQVPGKSNLPVYLAYFGTANPEYYHIPARIFPDYWLPWTRDISLIADSLGPGLYCVSATILQQVYGIRRQYGKDEEEAYRFSRKVVERFSEVADDDKKSEAFIERWGGRGRLMEIFRQFVSLRLAKLCHYLKQRPPDAMIGFSIMVYNLSSGELKAALLAPLKE